MKVIALSLLVSLSLFPSDGAIAGNSSVSDVVAVGCAEMRFSHAVESKDITLFRSLLDDEARFLSGNVLRGDAEISAGWSTFFADDAPQLVWRPATIEVLVADQLVFSRGPYRMRRSSDDAASESWGHYNSLWRKAASGDWQVIIDAGYPMNDDRQVSESERALLAQKLPSVCQNPDDAAILKEVVVAADRATVWNAWTTAEGNRFISDRSRIELREGGPYEWFLDLPADEQGRRGSEGSYVEAWVPEQLLVFAWTFPPDVPSLRYSGKFSHVLLELEDATAGATTVRLSVFGFEDGADWDAGKAYFDAAWQQVLSRLQQHFDSGS